MTLYGTIGGIVWVLFAVVIIILWSAACLAVKVIRYIDKCTSKGYVHFDDDDEVKSLPTDKTD